MKCGERQEKRGDRGREKGRHSMCWFTLPNSHNSQVWTRSKAEHQTPSKISHRSGKGPLAPRCSPARKWIGSGATSTQIKHSKWDSIILSNGLTTDNTKLRPSNYIFAKTVHTTVFYLWNTK